MDITLSIIIPTYQSQDTIKHCVQSILNQNIKNFGCVEIIVMDNNSSDDTFPLLTELKSKAPKGFYFNINRKQDHGVYDAMNKALVYAKGKWILFLGSDDQLIPNCLENLSRYLKKASTLYYGNCYRPRKNEIYDGHFSKLKVAVKNINHQSILYPKVILEDYQYNLRYKILADYDLNLKIFGNKQVNKVYVPVLISYYEDINHGISGSSFDKAFYSEKISIVRHSLGLSFAIYLSIRYTLGNLYRRICRKPNSF